MATTPKFNIALLAEDVAAQGWLPIDLAREAGTSDMTAYRALDGTCLTARTMGKFAAALGYDVRRYLVSSRKSKRASRRVAA